MWFVAVVCSCGTCMLGRALAAAWDLASQEQPQSKGGGWIKELCLLMVSFEVLPCGGLHKLCLSFGFVCTKFISEALFSVSYLLCEIIMHKYFQGEVGEHMAIFYFLFSTCSCS